MYNLEKTNKTCNINAVYVFPFSFIHFISFMYLSKQIKIN